MLQNFVSSKSLPHRILSHLCIEHVFSWCCLLYCRIFFFFSLLELVEWNSFKSYSYKMKFCLRQSDSLIPAVLLPCVMIHFKETEQRSIMGPISRNWGKNKQKQSKNNNTQSSFYKLIYGVVCQKLMFANRRKTQPWALPSGCDIMNAFSMCVSKAFF